MEFNKRQRLIAKWMIVLLILMVIFPPVHLKHYYSGPYGGVFEKENVGIRPIVYFKAYNNTPRFHKVHFPILLAEYLVLITLAMAAIVMNSRKKESVSERSPTHYSLFKHKKTIAREWLYIVCFAVIGLLFYYANETVFYPELEAPATLSNTNVEYLGSETAEVFVNSLLEQASHAEQDSIFGTIGYYDTSYTDDETGEYFSRMVIAFSNLADTKYEQAVSEYPSRLEVNEKISYTVWWVPYAMFLLIRSLVWAYRQVKTKAIQS